MKSEGAQIKLRLLLVMDKKVAVLVNQLFFQFHENKMNFQKYGIKYT